METTAARASQDVLHETLWRTQHSAGPARMPGKCATMLNRKIIPTIGLFRPRPSSVYQKRKTAMMNPGYLYLSHSVSVSAWGFAM